MIKYKKGFFITFSMIAIILSTHLVYLGKNDGATLMAVYSVLFYLFSKD